MYCDAFWRESEGLEKSYRSKLFSFLRNPELVPCFAVLNRTPYLITLNSSLRPPPLSRPLLPPPPASASLTGSIACREHRPVQIGSYLPSGSGALHPLPNLRCTIFCARIWCFFKMLLLLGLARSPAPETTSFVLKLCSNDPCPWIGIIAVRIGWAALYFLTARGEFSV